MMKNFKNYIQEIDIQEECFRFLQTELHNNYSFCFVKDLFSLPCMQYETRHKLAMILALLADREVNDTIIHWLTQILRNISDELWRDYEDCLSVYIEKDYHMLSRSQLLMLANTIEVMYAKGYKVLGLLNLIYQRIPLCDVEFNPDGEDNIRIKLAKVAYSTSRFNINDNLQLINCLKEHLKKTGRKYLLGMLNYYKGLCLEAAAYKLDYKDASYYIIKSRNKEFGLACVYLNYRGNHFETSKEC